MRGRAAPWIFTASARCSSIRQPAPPRLQDPTRATAGRGFPGNSNQGRGSHEGGQQHYKFCNKCRVNIAREATGRAVPGHPCSLDSWAGSLDAHGLGAGRSSIRRHTPGGPLFHQPTSTAAAPGSNEGANMRQQGCSCFHLSRATSWARVPGQHTHQAGGCCRFHLPALGGAAALFLDAGANTTRPRRGWLFHQATRATPTRRAAALFHPCHQLGGFLDAHGLGAGRSSIRRHQPAPPRPLGLFLGNPHSLGAANSWAGSLDARNCITFFVINIGAILARHPGPRPSSI